MQVIDRIRRRIRKTHSARRPHRLVSAFHHLVLALMLVCVLGLSLMIADRLQLPIALHAWDHIQRIQWSSFLPFETWFATEGTQSVAAIASYEEVGDHRYHNGSNEALTPFTATICHIEAQNDTYCVSLQLDDGTIVNIAHLQEVTVQEDERIQKGSTLGTYQEYVEIRCFLDGTELDLKDVEA